jgi:carbonic anhydrase
VKAGKASIAKYISSVSSIKADLQKNAQVDIRKRLVEELNPGDIRNALNKFNEAFSEETQKGTDRLIRNVLQDVLELQKDSIVKSDKGRSSVKVGSLVKRLDSTEKALVDLNAFLP